LLVQANDTLRLDRRNAKPRPAKPSSIIAQVDGSGTALAPLLVSTTSALGALLLALV
jgi:hypothetical protein